MSGRATSTILTIAKSDIVQVERARTDLAFVRVLHEAVKTVRNVAQPVIQHASNIYTLDADRQVLAAAGGIS